jgi:hypothetical protein
MIPEISQMFSHLARQTVSRNIRNFLPIGTIDSALKYLQVLTI